MRNYTNTKRRGTRRPCRNLELAAWPCGGVKLIVEVRVPIPKRPWRLSLIPVKEEPDGRCHLRSEGGCGASNGRALARSVSTPSVGRGALRHAWSPTRLSRCGRMTHRRCSKRSPTTSMLRLTSPICRRRWPTAPSLMMISLHACPAYVILTHEVCSNLCTPSTDVDC